MFFPRVFLFIFVLNFILSGLVINMIQLTIFIIIRPLNRKLFNYINNIVSYSLLSQLIVWFQLTGSKIRSFYSDHETRMKCRKRDSIAITNHTFEIDWLIAFVYACYNDFLTVSIKINSKILSSILSLHDFYRVVED